jgi:DNA-binding transcriptional LysR family regulator
VTATIDPDLSDIRVFLEVVDQGSFTAAGKILELPTSTVSRRITRLEAELGARLLQRTTRKLSVTDAGRIYYQRSQRALFALDEANQAVSQMQATPRGLVRMTAPVEMVELTELIAGFLAHHPEVQVSLDLTNRYVDLVKEGVDLAIRAGELGDSSLVAKQLSTATFVLAASPRYLKERGKPAKAEDLSDHDCIVSVGPGGPPVWRLCRKNKIVSVPVSGRLSTNHFGVVLRAAKLGLGIARLPRLHCAPSFADGSLVEVLPGSCPSYGKVSAVYPSREFMSPAVRALVDHFVATLKFTDEEQTPAGVL